MKNYDVIVVGSGLAGLSAAYQLSVKGKKVLLLEKEKFLGGRTSSFDDCGMQVEAGFHRHIGYYKKLPKLLKEIGVTLDDIVVWEDEIEIRIDKSKKIILGIDPVLSPVKFVKRIMGNHEYLSFKDKMSLLKLFILGFKDYKLHPKRLDCYSIDEYAKERHITESVISYIVTSLSTGIFFLNRLEYSAKVFFGLFYPGLFRVPSIRIGAYKRGMSEVLANPIGDAVRKLGGVIKLNSKVNSLLYENDKIIGVRMEDGTLFYANDVVLATDISNAKRLLREIPGELFTSIIDMPVMSAISVQLALKKPLMLKDRTTFAPFTVLTSFTEESRSTFKGEDGRLSVIIGEPDKYIDLSNEELLEMVIKDGKKIGLDIQKNLVDYRVVRHKNKFYCLSPGNDKNRLLQTTLLSGLTLAGDYTRNEMYATMEGAVMSGLYAAECILENKKAKF